jgi:hypothetical protein
MKLSDTKFKRLSDASDTCISVKEIREAKILASGLYKLYGKRYTLGEIVHENKVYLKEASRSQKDV